MEEETGFDLKRVNEFIEYKNKLYQRKKRFDEGKIELMQIIDDMEELYSFVKRNVHLISIKIFLIFIKSMLFVVYIFVNINYEIFLL